MKKKIIIKTDKQYNVGRSYIMPSYKYQILVNGNVYHKTYSSWEHYIAETDCQYKGLKYETKKIPLW